jgi:hypothetical protein
MKKVLFILMCMFTLGAEAQDLQGWHVGIVLQPYNYWLYSKSSVNTDDPLNYIFVQPKLGKFNGVAGGLSLDYYFSDKFAVGGELSYSNQTQRYTNQDKERREFINLRYLQVPILAKFRLTPNRVGSIYVNAGIQNSFLTYSYHYQEYVDSKGTLDFYNSVKNNTVHNFSDKDYTYKISKSVFKTYQLGIVAELGYHYSIGDRYNINLGIRCGYDLTTAKNIHSKFSFMGKNEDLGWWSPYIGMNDRNLRLGLNLGCTYALQ